MKKYITIAAVGLIAIIGTKAFAQGGPHGKCHPGKAFVEDVDLTAEQEALVKELRELKKEKHGQMKGKRGERLDTMIEFVEGDLSREDVHQKITDKHNQKVQEASEMSEVLFDLLDSYSSEQKEQVASNLEETKECMEEFKGKHEKKMKEMQGKKGPGKLLFKDLDLTKEQQELLEKIEDGKEDFRRDHRAHQGMIEDVLSGKIDTSEAEENFLQKSSERHEKAHEKADAMMDLLETFSQAQKEQFIENAETLQEKMKNRMEHRGPRGGNFEKE